MDGARQAAVDACLAHSGSGPASLVEAVADGLGDWLVWVEDRSGALWSCNADAAGLVYAYAPVLGDLLEGGGAEFLTAAPQLTSGIDAGGNRARDLCLGVASLTQGAELVASVADGLGDVLVWLRMADDRLWMCNASEDGKLFVFEPVGFPLDPEHDGSVASAS